MTNEQSSRRFAGRTVIVTGAGSGIGRATAVRVAREGGHVVAADLDAPSLRKLADECGAATVTTVEGDITAPAVVARVAAAGGRVDALANVAGIMDGFLPPSTTVPRAYGPTPSRPAPRSPTSRGRCAPRTRAAAPDR